MLRVIGLTLVVVTGAAKVADAEGRFDRPSASRIETALQHSPTGPRQPGTRHSGVQLQIGGGLAFAPTADHQGSGQLEFARTERQQRARESRRLVRSRNAYGRAEDWLNVSASSKPSLAYAVNDSLSLGLDYHYQSSESMNFKIAKVGGLDPSYHSHSLMFQARVEF
jgi:hypothetical protein